MPQVPPLILRSVVSSSVNPALSHLPGMRSGARDAARNARGRRGAETRTAVPRAEPPAGDSRVPACPSPTRGPSGPAPVLGSAAAEA